mmetsp:Transcript_8132/g.23106  ORF Transcript_8132/g.23106 Transcript_8132/m.23106 type:complete len:239 (-) Transcript_8132:162-878(-)
METRKHHGAGGLPGFHGWTKGARTDEATGPAMRNPRSEGCRRAVQLGERSTQRGAGTCGRGSPGREASRHGATCRARDVSQSQHRMPGPLETCFLGGGGTPRLGSLRQHLVLPGGVLRPPGREVPSAPAPGHRPALEPVSPHVCPPPPPGRRRKTWWRRMRSVSSSRRSPALLLVPLMPPLSTKSPTPPGQRPWHGWQQWWQRGQPPCGRWLATRARRPCGASRPCTRHSRTAPCGRR